MRKAIVSCAATLSVFLFAMTAFTDHAYAGSENGASISSDFRCSMPDASRRSVVSDVAKNHSVITNNSKSSTILKCTIHDVPNNTGKAVRFSNFACNTFMGTTRNSHQVISASGVGTLTCMILHR